MGAYELRLFVTSELNELETRDIDTLYECLQDNLAEMGVTQSDALDMQLYSEIKRQIERISK